MYIPDTKQTGKIERKNSLFIATVRPISAEEQAKAEIQRTRDEHPKADHVVWAFRIDQPAQQQEGFSDDGEPGGTAGKPVISLIHHLEFTNILITVVRYFGGTKLGKGGLVRAYTDSAQEALKELPKHRLVRTRDYTIVVDYRFYEAVRSFLDAGKIVVQGETFREQIDITCALPREHSSEIAQRIADITNGTAQMREHNIEEGNPA
jgi:uncharacterized YigZ family protein